MRTIIRSSTEAVRGCSVIIPLEYEGPLQYLEGGLHNPIGQPYPSLYAYTVFRQF